MPDDAERPLSLRQADQARADLYAIHDELEFLRTQPARARKDIARVALLAVACGAALSRHGAVEPGLSLTGLSFGVSLSLTSE
jgi:hypothetical protein